MVATAIAVGLFVAGAALTVQGQRRQAKAAAQAQGEQRKQTAISNAQQSIARNREIRQVIAQQRAAQAEQLQAGFGSGFAGAVSAIGADTGSALGAAQTQAGAARGIAASQDAQGRHLLESQRQNSHLQAGSFLTGLSGMNFSGLSSASGAPGANPASGSGQLTGFASNRPLSL